MTGSTTDDAARPEGPGETNSTNSPWRRVRYSGDKRASNRPSTATNGAYYETRPVRRHCHIFGLSYDIKP
jgi:hypothetical protein